MMNDDLKELCDKVDALGLSDFYIWLQKKGRQYSSTSIWLNELGVSQAMIDFIEQLDSMERHWYGKARRIDAPRDMRRFINIKRRQW